jgi:hypothetical protein
MATTVKARPVRLCGQRPQRLDCAYLFVVSLRTIPAAVTVQKGADDKAGLKEHYYRRKKGREEYLESYPQKRFPVSSEPRRQLLEPEEQGGAEELWAYQHQDNCAEKTGGEGILQGFPTD